MVRCHGGSRPPLPWQAKALWQQIRDGKNAYLINNDLRIWAHLIQHDLPAGATRSERGGIGWFTLQTGDREAKRPGTGGEGGEDRDPLRTDRETIRGRLDIAAVKDLPAIGFDRRANRESRVWHLRVSAGLACFV